jgi:hypothetical protein
MQTVAKSTPRKGRKPSEANSVPNRNVCNSKSIRIEGGSELRNRGKVGSRKREEARREPKVLQIVVFAIRNQLESKEAPICEIVAKSTPRKGRKPSEANSVPNRNVCNSKSIRIEGGSEMRNCGKVDPRKREEASREPKVLQIVVFAIRNRLESKEVQKCETVAKSTPRKGRKPSGSQTCSKSSCLQIEID